MASPWTERGHRQVKFSGWAVLTVFMFPLIISLSVLHAFLFGEFCSVCVLFCFVHASLTLIP